MGTLTFILGMLASGFCGLFVFMIGLFRAQLTRQHPGTIFGVLGVGMVAGTGLTTLLALGDYAVPAPLPPFFLPGLILLMLPRRKPRRSFSVQRVGLPYATIGQALFVIGCVATAILSLLLWWAGEVPWWLALLFLLIGAGASIAIKAAFTNAVQPGGRSPPSPICSRQPLALPSSSYERSTAMPGPLWFPTMSPDTIRDHPSTSALLFQSTIT